MIRSSNLEVPYQTAFTNGAAEAVADVPVEKGGGGQGFGPHELLEAALATCVTMTAQMFAADHGLPLTAARCAVRIDRSMPGAATLTYALALDGPLSGEQSARVRDAVSRCPVARTLTGAITLRPATPAGPNEEGAK